MKGAACVLLLLGALFLLFAIAITSATKHDGGRRRRSGGAYSVPPQLSSTYYKRLAGPPSEFPDHVLPTPSQNALESRTTFLPFTLQPAPNYNNNNGAIEGDRTLVGMETKFPVDSSSEFKISILSPILNDLIVEISPPPSSPLLLKNAAELARQYCLAAGITDRDVVDEEFGDGAIRVPSRTFTFPKPETGLWLLRVTSKESALAAFPDPVQPHMFVLLDMESELKTWTHVNSYDLETGKQIGLVTRLIDTEKRQYSSRDGSPVPIRFTPDTVVMEIRLPDGHQEEIPMKDDGMHSDGMANDGVYGATVLATEVGSYSFQVVMHGVLSDGRQFLRTSEHIIETVDDDFTLTGEVLGEMSTDDKALMLSLIGSWTPSQSDFTFKGYMEVWGVDAETGSKDVPIAWVGGLADAQSAPPGALQGVHSLTFRLDTNWIALAKAKAPFTLRNVYVQDRLNSIPLTQLAEAPVKLRRFAASRQFETLQFDGPITEEMLKGPRPAFLTNPSKNATTVEGHKLVLVHGYCAPTNSWKYSDFTDYALFEDIDQNRRNDEFARLIVQFASQFNSFSLISHSQGGLASLHLYTFYWSGADNANGKRFLQSVGSPYQGNGLAGILAKIGSWLGIGCDTNFDLTYDGAKLWLASVPLAARSQVDFYTTQYKPLSWCNLAANAVLKWPNDGVVEKALCQLPGGNNKGHKEKWCHTASMKYPPQTTDSDRNRIMNQNAHRG